MPDHDHQEPVANISDVSPVLAAEWSAGADIVFSQVTKKYGDTLAVKSLDLHIPGGSIVVFVGPSGCGKTTTLKMINRLIEPSSGSITVNEREVHDYKVHQLRRAIGYVIQGGSLFPHMTVARNISTVLRLLNWDKVRIDARVKELLELVGLDAGFVHRYPRELSGGQAQRVGVARALAADPPVMLMDEPFGALDPVTRENLQDEMLRLHARLHKTLVMVSHDIEEALKMGDYLCVFSEQGVVEQFGTPAEVLLTPNNDYVREFVGGKPGRISVREEIRREAAASSPMSGDISEGQL